jgi:phosphoacetylglucosamine mutase
VAPVVCRAAILAALCSTKLGRTATRLVITASHNPVCNKGIKTADPDGGMLDQHWEPFADALTNVGDPDALLHLLLQFAKDEGIPLGGGGPQVLLDRDTRLTGEYILNAVLQVCHAHPHLYSLGHTTSHLHFL